MDCPPELFSKLTGTHKVPCFFSSEFRPWWPEGHWVLASVSSYQPLSVAVFSTGCARFPPFSAEDDAGGGKPVTTGAVLLTIQQRVNRDERIASGRGFGGKQSAKWGVQCWFSFFRWGRHTIKTWSGCSQPVQFFLKHQFKLDHCLGDLCCLRGLWQWGFYEKWSLSPSIYIQPG